MSTKSAINIAFLMDPLSGVVPEKDTGFAIMEGAVAAGDSVYFIPQNGLSYTQNKVMFAATKVRPDRNGSPPFKIIETVTLSEDDIDLIFVRSEPPFNERYQMNMWMLDLLSKNIPIINNPRGIMTVNEKVWCSRFSDLTPSTCISSQKTTLQSFVNSHKGKVIAKPCNGYGGSSVFIIDEARQNKNVILETLSKTYTEEIILQHYLKGAENGDKRILLLGGEALGALLRVHSSDDHRNNFFAGGHSEPCTVTNSDLDIIRTLKPFLLDLGLHLVGIDIIDDKLVEVNVTSPTCLQEMNTFMQSSLETNIITYAKGLL